MDYALHITTDEATAKTWWELLSPKSSAFDDWDFRACFARHTGSGLHFIAAERDGAVRAVLPLQRGRMSGILEPFGGSIMEDNGVLWDGSDPDAPRALLTAVAEPMLLQYCRDHSSVPLPAGIACRPHAEKFILPLDPADPQGGLFDRFNAKSRAQLKKKLREVDEHDVAVAPGGPEHVDALIAFNVENFGESSFFNLPGRKEAFRDLALLPQANILTFTVDGVLRGASCCILANGTSAYINSGTQHEAVPNLGTYLIVKLIEHAVAAGATLFDGGTYPYNWKTRLHLDRRPVWELSRVL